MHRNWAKLHIETVNKELISVGIDIGTTTSHLVLSKLTLEKDMLSRTEKFEVTKREILYEGRIFFTPLINGDEIDFKRLSEIFKEEFERYGLQPKNIDSGAVIITGETAKKENARRVVELISGEAGRFVAASAGPHLESIFSAKGSGAVDRSRKKSNTILTTDVGGGTSNIALVVEGEVVETACINVGGRLIVYDKDRKITRIEPAGRHVLNSLDLSNTKIGSFFSTETEKAVVQRLGECLFEVLTYQQDLSPLTKELLMTEPLTQKTEIDEIAYSGGVAEFIYDKVKSENYGDLGSRLGRHIADTHTKNFSVPMVEPGHRIRATVIGAGQFSLSVSGSTIFFSKNIMFPISSLPVVVPRVDRENLSEEQVAEAIQAALGRFDTSVETLEDPLVLGFNDPVRTAYTKLTTFVRGVEAAILPIVQRGLPVLMVFDTDIGNSVGNVMARETKIHDGILSIDEIKVEEGDFIDIGKPIIEGKIIPVIVKSLVFSN